MDKKKPVNLALTTIRLPITAISSILHRISGFILFLFIPLLLCLLQHSLVSEQSFSDVAAWLAQPLVKFVIWGLLSMLAYHFLAGIRHLLMDVGIWEGKESGKRSATVTIGLAVVAILIVGCWIW